MRLAESASREKHFRMSLLHLSSEYFRVVERQYCALEFHSKKNSISHYFPRHWRPLIKKSKRHKGCARVVGNCSLSYIIATCLCSRQGTRSCAMCFFFTNVSSRRRRTKTDRKTGLKWMLAFTVWCAFLFLFSFSRLCVVFVSLSFLTAVGSIEVRGSRLMLSLTKEEEEES